MFKTDLVVLGSWGIIGAAEERRALSSLNSHSVEVAFRVQLILGSLLFVVDISDILYNMSSSIKRLSRIAHY